MIAALLIGRTAGPFAIETQDGRISSLRYAADSLHTDYLAQNKTLGEVKISYRKGVGPWETPAESQAQIDPAGTGREWLAGEDLHAHSWFEPKGDRLIWHVRIDNRTQKPVEIGGLSMPLPMRTRIDRTAKTGVLKHSFVSGAGSFMFWMRPDSLGPYLTMTCGKGTSLEYWKGQQGPQSAYQVFAHSAAQEPDIKAHQGSWRLPHTSRIIGAHDAADYSFVFEWAKDYQAVRDLLAHDGKLDVQVVPGMTVPNDLFAEVALRSDEKIEGVDAEHPRQTDIRYEAARGGYKIYKVRFNKLGENLLTVRQPGGAKTYLEFFSTLPVETLIKKRAAFLAKNQQRDPAKWYEGLFSEWNMASQTRLSPDNYDRIKGWRIYEVTCDDPGLGKPAFLAAKNAEYPNPDEISRLDEYIAHFVWGGLQRSTDEKYPYAIYGIPDWKTLRDSQATDKTKGIYHLWRCYDYPHIVLLYRSMYRIALQNPGIKTRLSTREYLKRAYGTAAAMFTIPDELVHWSAFDTGFYNEVIIPPLIEDLRAAGMAAEANKLQGYWARKTRTFLAGRNDLFGSEYAFDSTGFESTEALADYAVRNEKSLRIDDTRARSFLEHQMAANVFCRGSIEPAYYLLGSDYRGGGGDGYTLSYMAPMGGSGVLHYALNYTKDPSYLRLGYQSILSSWALTNAGTAGSNYGYWFPGEANDGGAGGGFEPASYGETWLGQPHGRGSWYYACETDLGYCGYLRAARTVVADDPIFGRFCFGGVSVGGSGYRFVPHDGVRRRLSIRTSRVTLDVELTGTQFDSASPIQLDEKSGRLRFLVGPAALGSVSLSHAATVRVDGAVVSPSGAGYPLGASQKSRWIEITFGSRQG